MAAIDIPGSSIRLENSEMGNSRGSNVRYNPARLKVAVGEWGGRGVSYPLLTTKVQSPAVVPSWGFGRYVRGRVAGIMSREWPLVNFPL